MLEAESAGWIQGMNLALEQARLAFAEGEIPVGAVLLDASGQLLAADHNRPIADHDPTAHAEIRVLRQGACIKQNYRLSGTVLLSTVEPCLMCAGALIQARIAGLVYGTDDPKAGAITSKMSLFEDCPWLNHRFWIQGGVLAEQSRELLQAFFAGKRCKADFRSSAPPDPADL